MYVLLLALANMVKLSHYHQNKLLIWCIFCVQQEEKDSICYDQRIALFQRYANEVVLFALLIIIYLLIGFGGKQFKAIKMKRFF